MSRKQKEILIVEDEADIRDLMAFHLAKDNLFVDTAGDGRIAYDKLRKNKYDLVIVDWMVPEISGLYLVSWMRKPNHIQRKTPALMVTAKSDPDNIVLGLETGADDYMVKPFDFEVLRARVQNLLKRGAFLESKAGAVATGAVATGGAAGAAAGRGAGLASEGAVFTVGELTLNKKSHEVALRGRPLSLTLSEFRLLEILIAHQGRVLSRKRLAAYLQGPLQGSGPGRGRGEAFLPGRAAGRAGGLPGDKGAGLRLNLGTRILGGDKKEQETRRGAIDTHISSLRKKLGKYGESIQTVRGVGYRLSFS